MSPSVGTSVSRKDGIGKATGATKYADDIVLPGMLHGRTIRSTVARGTITGINLNFDTTGFTIVDYRDIPAAGRNVVALIKDDQPYLVEREVQHVAEPILLLAHEDRDILLAAKVMIGYDVAEPVYDPLHSDTAFKVITIEKGAVDDMLAGAEIVVEGEYRTGHQEHVYIETNGVIAVPEDGGITVYGSMQCPFYALKALKGLFGPSGKVRVVQTETGGGFGGKEEYPSMIAGHAALLAMKSGRPVKIIYDRVEDMVATTKRHPSIVRHHTGLTRDGRICGMDVEVIIDGGAYATLSEVVLSRGSIHAAGPYRCEHTRIHARAMKTNTPPNGAFRGFGAPQTEFAIEVHMDRIAEALGMCPVALREKNALVPGDTTATGQVLREDASALECLREAVTRTDFLKKRESYRGTNKGIGLALFYHGAGFTGAGEERLKSKARLDLTPTGARILVASTEIGQGTRTMHAQIVSDALGIPYEDVEVAMPDTAISADSGPTVASRTCMVVGKILERCAVEMKAQLGGMTPARYYEEKGPLSVILEHVPPAWINWDDDTYQGDAYPTYGWGCDVVELTLDPDTYEARPTHVTAVQEFGRPIHPALAQGQIEGGTVQGLGFALLEHVVMRDGAMANPTLTNYTIPTTLDTPVLDIVMLENPYEGGPSGAKGLGELPIDGPAPAVVNALRHLGLDLREIPAIPETLMACNSL
jgi:CO/xanthine dehydrogenase Mo-binding subunit